MSFLMTSQNVTDVVPDTTSWPTSLGDTLIIMELNYWSCGAKMAKSGMVPGVCRKGRSGWALQDDRYRPQDLSTCASVWPESEPHDLVTKKIELTFLHLDIIAQPLDVVVVRFLPCSSSRLPQSAANLCVFYCCGCIGVDGCSEGMY